MFICLWLKLFLFFSFDEGPDDIDDEEALDEPIENEVGKCSFKGTSINYFLSALKRWKNMICSKNVAGESIDLILIYIFVYADVL